MAKRKQLRKRKRQSRPAPVIDPNAAGIDVGATEVYVSVPTDRDSEPVRTFATFTRDFHELSDWLAACGVKTVAITVLGERGIEVCLVNARHLKRVPGRKSDVLDCEWLQYLHSVGLLQGSFHPPEAVSAVRTVLRHRTSLVQIASSHVQRMQKALTEMNVQLHHVISDITGLTGLAILDAILAGERRPKILAGLRHPQSLHRSESCLGDSYRRMRYRLGPPKAITATAHKLARIIYLLVSTHQPYDDSVLAHDEHQTRTRKTRRLKSLAQALGYELAPLPSP